jgi:hypothetical protein
MGLAELAQAADLVLLGRVTGQQAGWDAAHRSIVTEVSIKVEDCLKGQARPGAVLKLHRLGGTVDGIGMRTIGEPAFADGEDTLLFLSSGAGGMLRVVGMAQGKLTVSRDPRIGERVVQQDLRGLSLLERDAQGAAHIVEPGSAPLLPLAKVLGELRAHLGKGRGGGR